MIGTTRRGGVLARFLGECCEIGQGYRCDSGSLYAVYAAWCEREDEYQESQKALGLFLIERGFERIRSNRSRGYVGLRLTAAVSARCERAEGGTTR